MFAGWESASCEVDPPKTATSRWMVDPDPSTVEVLLEHRARQTEEREIMRNAHDNQGRVLADAYGGWASTLWLYKNGRGIRVSDRSAKAFRP